MDGTEGRRMRDDRIRLLQERGVTVVLDVGANAGQYARRLRADGYTGTIVSFEPLRDAYEQLRAAANGDPGWQTINVALGEAPAVATMNVSANSYSSSFLPLSVTTVDAAPDAEYVGTESVTVTALDLLDLPSGTTMLKADVQGYEPAVLRGAPALLRTVEVIELELSLVPNYDGQELAPAVCALLRDLGFVPVAMEASFVHPETGEILQIDALFARPQRRAARPSLPRRTHGIRAGLRRLAGR
jgi:FkbM family methyltransferase